MLLILLFLVVLVFVAVCSGGVFVVVSLSCFVVVVVEHIDNFYDNCEPA